jgi:hypothetical protein
VPFSCPRNNPSAGCDSFRSKELRMGAWGTSILSDDTTRDIYDSYLDLFNRGNRRSDQTRILASPSPRWMFGENSMMFAIVSRGKNSGRRLLPHRYKDNRYHVSLGDEGPYIPISDDRNIPCYLANGYFLRMSNRAESRKPSLIRPESIRGWK